MREFDLEAAKRGEPIVCRDGIKAKFITHFSGISDDRCVIALIMEKLFIFGKDGKHVEENRSSYDLFMAPNKRTVWVNLHDSPYIARYFSTEYEANQYPSYMNIKRIGNRAWPLEIEE